MDDDGNRITVAEAIERKRISHHDGLRYLDAQVRNFIIFLLHLCLN